MAGAEESSLRGDDGIGLPRTDTVGGTEEDASGGSTDY